MCITRQEQRRFVARGGFPYFFLSYEGLVLGPHNGWIKPEHLSSRTTTMAVSWSPQHLTIFHQGLIYPYIDVFGVAF